MPMASSGWCWGAALELYCVRAVCLSAPWCSVRMGSSGVSWHTWQVCYKFVLMGIYELFPWPRGPCMPVCYEGREVTLGKLVLWGGSEEMGLKCLLAFRVCCAHIAL